MLALQAAFLDQGIVSVIAKLLSNLMRDNGDDPESTSLCTMALEVVTVLFNPDICLNPLHPVTQRVVDDCPSVREVSSLLFVQWFANGQHWLAHWLYSTSTRQVCR